MKDMRSKLRIPLAAALISVMAASPILADTAETETATETEITAETETTAETEVTQADSPAPVQTGWVQGDDGLWRYYWSNGTLARSTWIEDGEDTWYFIDDDGTMRTGWLQNGDDWYFFDSSGVMQTGAIRVEDRVYYMSYDGSLYVGRHRVNGIRYTFTENGCAGQMPYTSKIFHSDGTPYTEAERQNLTWSSSTS